MDFDVPDSGHATMSRVESLAVTFNLERLLLSGMFRHRPATMCRILVFATNHQLAPGGLDAHTDTQLRAISVHGGFPRRIKGLGTVTDPLAQTPRDAPGDSPCSISSAG